ncbi:MAG: bacteriohemerythrin [Clostridia bacterium]|nr:bacteriohemerythrin [Clostridia bacterium]
MAMFAWDEKYSVNVKEFNDHHKKLIDLINELHDGMKVGKGKEIMSTMLKKLIDYTQFHFSTEEKYLTRYAYPEYQLHKAQHDQFVNKVLKFQQDFEKGNILASMDVMNFLKDWLVNHILVIDKKYVPFLNEKGVK